MSKDAPSFVTVACKLPHGLQMRLKDKVITLRGANAPDAISGFGLTIVPEDFWNEWSKQYRALEPLAKNLIFAYQKGGDARAAAKEKADMKTGLEQLDPNSIVAGVKPDDQMKNTPAAPAGETSLVEDE
jgi:hypothetical protein